MRKITIKQYFVSSGDALSQLINAVLFASGNANESISGRSYEERDHWFFGKLRTGIDRVAKLFGQTDHCEKAWQNDLDRAKAIAGCANTKSDDE